MNPSKRSSRNTKKITKRIRLLDLSQIEAEHNEADHDEQASTDSESELVNRSMSDDPDLQNENFEADLIDHESYEPEQQVIFECIEEEEGFADFETTEEGATESLDPDLEDDFQAFQSSEFLIEAEPEIDQQIATPQTTASAFALDILQEAIQKKVSYDFVDFVLKKVWHYYDKDIPLSHKTLINRLMNKLLAYEVYSMCNCNKVLLFKEDLVSCTSCNQLMKKKTQMKDHGYVLSFSLEKQLQKVSLHTDPDDIPIPKDRSKPYTVRLILALDGIPLSKSSTHQLYPLMLFIENFSNRKKMNSIKT